MLFKNSGIALICRVLHGLFKLASELFGINIQVSNSYLHTGVCIEIRMFGITVHGISKLS